MQATSIGTWHIINTRRLIVSSMIIGCACHGLAIIMTARDRVPSPSAFLPSDRACRRFRRARTPPRPAPPAHGGHAAARPWQEEKYRKIRLGNAAFQARVGSLAGGMRFLTTVGFAPDASVPLPPPPSLPRGPAPPRPGPCRMPPAIRPLHPKPSFPAHWALFKACFLAPGANRQQAPLGAAPRCSGVPLRAC